MKNVKIFPLFVALCFASGAVPPALAAQPVWHRQDGTVLVPGTYADVKDGKLIPRDFEAEEAFKKYIHSLRIEPPLSRRSMQTLRLGAEDFVSESGGYYEAYKRVLSGCNCAPEENALPLQARVLLDEEGQAVARLLNKHAWARGGVKRRHAEDVGIEILFTGAAILLTGSLVRGPSSRFAASQGLKYGGRLGGLASLAHAEGGRLARLAVGGPWKWYGWIRVKTFVFDFSLFTFIMTPLAGLYDRFIPRLANYEYLTDMKITFSQQKSLLEAFAILNRADEKDVSFAGYDGAPLESSARDGRVWKNKSVKRNSLALLYALRHLRHYLQTSQDAYRDDLVLIELLHLSLPYGVTHTTANGVELEGNPGRLLFEDEREEIIRQLQDMARTEEFVRREILPKCAGKTGMEYGMCVKFLYQSGRYGRQLA